MNLLIFKDKALRFACKAGFALKKYAPEILLVLGIAGVVGGIALVGKESMEAKEVIDDYKDSYKEAYDDSRINDEELRAYLRKEKFNEVKELSKIYWPSAVVILVSLASIISSHGIMQSRAASLAAAYAALAQAFGDYRKHVAEEIGEKKEAEIASDVTQSLIASGRDVEYAFCFDETCAPNTWKKDSEANKRFLVMQSNYLNERLASRGYIFLNEVLEALGLPKTKAGQVVGWVYNKAEDNKIDFGCFGANDVQTRRFMNGYERSVWLTFNVMGDITYVLER